MKTTSAKIISVIIAVAMVISGIPIFSAAAAENDKTITAFVYDNNGKNPKDDISEYASAENDYIYKSTSGVGSLSGSVTGEALKHLEWSDSEYADEAGNSTGIVPALTASKTNNWGAPYVSFSAEGLSGYSSLSVTFDFSASKKGPANYKVTAVEKNTHSEPVELGSFALTTPKVMKSFNFDIPESFNSASALEFRIAADGEATVAGSTLSASPSGGEFAFNNILVKGVSNASEEPSTEPATEPEPAVTTEQLQALIDTIPADLSVYTDESAAPLKTFLDNKIGWDKKQTPELSWTQGGLKTTTGKVSGSANWIKSNMIDTSAFRSVCLTSKNGNLNIFWYDENGNFKGSLFEDNKKAQSMRNRKLPVEYPKMRIAFCNKNGVDPSCGNNVTAVFSDRILLEQLTRAETESLYNELNGILSKLERITPQSLLKLFNSEPKYLNFYTDESVAGLKTFMNRLGKGNESALDLNWSQGGVNRSSGSSNWIRTSYIDLNNCDYIKLMKDNSAYKMNLYYYDKDKNYLGSLFENGRAETLNYSIFRVKYRYLRIALWSGSSITPDTDTTMSASVFSSADLDGYSDAEIVSMYHEYKALAEKTTPVYKTAEVPQVYISTNNEDGNELLKMTGYVSSSVSVVDTDGSVLTASGNIKVRGNSTAYAEKKPYNIKFDKKQNVFGFGSAKKWALLANAYDPTMMRNNIAQQFAKNVGLDYTSNIKTVEVWIDGFYKGCYDFVESVEVGSTRVDINIEGNNDFLLEREKNRVEEGVSYVTSDGIRFSVNEPETPTQEQLSYISEKLDNVTDTLKTLDYNAIKDVIDIDSFAKFYVVNEIVRPADFAFSSTRYYYKGGKLYAGPCWDYDISSGNTITKGYKSMPVRDAQFYNYLFQTEEFVTAVKNCLRDNYDYIENIAAKNGLIDTMLKQNGNVYSRNYSDTDWMLEKCYYTNHTRIPDSTLEENMAFCKQWFKDRINYIFDYYDVEPSPATLEQLNDLIASVPADLSVYTDESAASLNAFLDSRIGRDNKQTPELSWTQGGLSTATGKPSSSANWIKSDMIDTSEFNSVRLTSKNGNLNIFWYDANGKYKGSLFEDNKKSQSMRNREISVNYPKMRIAYWNKNGADPSCGNNVTAIFSDKVILNQLSETEINSLYRELKGLLRELELKNE
jgi:hypothetical protein